MDSMKLGVYLKAKSQIRNVLKMQILSVSCKISSWLVFLIRFVR
jgi:hypothetical protein